MRSVKRVVLFLFLVLIPLSRLSGEQDTPPSYYLTIGTMFKNEAKWLKEWIEFHHLLGVEHFYLYNNLSDDDYLEVLTPYISQGLVTLIDWPLPITNPGEFAHFQAQAMLDCLHKADSKWIALIDIDEFMFPVQADNLKKFLSSYDKFESVGAIYVNWYLYGTSYVYEIPKDKLLIETLTRRAKKADPIGKVIVKPEAVTGFNTIHRPAMLSGFWAIYPNCNPVCRWGLDNSNTRLIRINHYWSRDRKYYDEVKSRRGNISDHANNQEFLEGFITDTFNHKEDHEILKFVPELRQLMNLDAK